MKQITSFISIIAIVIYSLNSCAQSNSQQALNSLSQTIGATPEQYFHLADSIANGFANDSAEGGVKNRYERFRLFYKTRMPAKVDTDGLFKPYVKAVEKARLKSDANQEEESDVCNLEAYRGDWENIGPKTDMPTYQNIGVVRDIWVDPLNENNILAASENGGLWRQVPNGTGFKWINLTDNATMLGTMAIQSMAVNPLNTDEIYISTSAGEHFFGKKYGLGVFHTMDGGITWVKEMTLPDPDFILVNKIVFCPYLVNSLPYVVLSSKDQIFAKLGSTGTWTPLTSGLKSLASSQFGDITNLSDIEFANANDIMSGTFFVASNWDSDPVSYTTGVWKFQFDLTNGTIVAGSPTEIINKDCNDMSGIITQLNGQLTGSTVNQYYSIEYVGNGKFYIAIVPIVNQGNWYVLNSGTFENVIIEWDMNTPTVCTTLVNNIINTFNDQCATNLSVSSYNTNVMYLGRTQANIIYRYNNAWHWKSISDYSSSTINYPIHADIRKVYLYKSNINASYPGMDDIVFWGNDGGISKTFAHNIQNIQTHDNNNNQQNVCQRSNLNGEGLYISDAYDVDKEIKGRSIATASYHDGFQVLNKATNLWGGASLGDGLTASFDDRFSTNNDYRILYKNSNSWNGVNSFPMNFYHNPFAITPASISGLTHQPENGRYTPVPIHFRADRMDLGIKNAWESESSITSDGYGGGSTTGWTNYFQSSSTPQDLQTRISETDNIQFMVAPSNATVAYNLLNGSKTNFILTKGKKNGSVWNWNQNGTSDITPSVVSDLDNGVIGTDFAVDPLNADRIFLSLGYIVNPNAPDLKRVLVSEDAGVTWSNMSTGLTELPVNCLLYQNGSDDLIYAGCDDGVYYWWKPTQCWRKMNNHMPNCMVSKLSISYCDGKLLAATYGRGIWQSDLYIPNNNPGVTDNINANTTWTGDKYIEGSIKVLAGHTLTISGTTNNPTTIHLPKYGKIIVEKGAKLIIDGATLTNSCDAMWTGIYVEADPSLRQISTSGGYYTQGYCEIKNGAIIENSENGIANYNVGTLGGGIIMAYNSIFKNNRRSLEFMKYQNSNSVGTQFPEACKVK